jgi:hypothetical protein
MSFTHILRVLFAIALSGAMGWLCLVAFQVLKLLKGLEASQALAADSDFGMLPSMLARAAHDIECGSALFLAAGIAGVLLSEIFKTRSFLFYSGATGALTAILAAALWRQVPGAGQTASALAMAGFVAGAFYWMIAGPATPRA